MSWLKQGFKATQWRRYWFEPKPDITAYELAILTANVISYGDSQIGRDGLYLPADMHARDFFLREYGTPNMDRHFVRTESLTYGPDL